MTNENFTNKLSRGLSALERRHKRFMNIALEEDGIPSNIPYRYILAIKRNPDASQDFLADLFGVDKSHVARKIREIELEGYIVRQPVPENRRQYRLNLTEKGERAYLLIRKRNDEWEALITKGIEADDLITTSRTIGLIIENLDA